MPFAKCEERRNALLNDLNDPQKDKGFCDDKCIALLLGAGCNMHAVEGCNFPSWPKLLEELSMEGRSIDSSRYLEEAGRIEKLFSIKNEEYIRRRFNELAMVPTEEQIEALSAPETAYRMAKYVKIALMNDVSKPADSAEPRDGSTMKCVIDVCVKRVENSLRTIVITYNYDDFFEYLLKKALRKTRDEDTVMRIVRSVSDNLPDFADLVCRGSDGPSVDIFYVHGRISIFDEGSVRMSKRIILSQQSYDRLSRNHLEAANQIQYVVQAGIPMVSVGFSFDDVNFSRLRTDLHANCRKLPLFYSLQYCNSDNCATCIDEKKRAMQAQLDHIDTLKIKALPMPDREIQNSFKILFNT